MLNAKININGLEWNLTGDKEDIVYALKNATSSSVLPVNKIIEKISPTINGLKSNISSNSKKKPSKFSREEMIKMYKYLDAEKRFQIKQFEITRGGKKDPVQFKVCLVFDEKNQRYHFYNPKTEDRYIRTFTVDEVINKINASEAGFSLIHSVANRLAEKINIRENLLSIVSGRAIPDKTDPFPTNENIFFNNYDVGSTVYDASIDWINSQPSFFSSKALNMHLRSLSYSDKKLLKKNLSILQKNKVIQHMKAYDKKINKLSKCKKGISRFYEKVNH